MVTPINIKGKTLGFVDSRIGGRKENQDSAGFRETELGSLIVVCDGMGGMQGGSVASQLAVQIILDTVAAADKKTNPSTILIQAIKKANIAIIERGKNNPNLRGMGTTVTILLLTPYSALTAYVGDSRIYQLRNGEKIFRTFDHSMVFEMVKKKIISEEQARLSAQSNVILKALGVNDNVEVEIAERSYKKGDRFVLCSDGFWGAMPEEDFIRHLVESNPIDKILESTANVVESIGRNSEQEFDNLTAAILEMDSNSILKEKMNRTAKIIILIISVLLLMSVALNFFMAMQNKIDKTLSPQKEQVDSIKNTNKAKSSSIVVK